MPTLNGGAVLLRPWRVEDARWYVEARDEEVYRWTTEKRTLTVQETEAAIRQVNAGEQVSSFAIVATESGQLVGNIALALDKQDLTTGEVMYWLAAAGRGRGLASQAVQLVCQWAFVELGLERITLQTYAGNTRSQRVAESAGFQRMDAQQADDTESNRVWFSKTRPGV
jgi:[ribosomal protein S5]-alanine N-acetyltransferase